LIDDGWDFCEEGVYGNPYLRDRRCIAFGIEFDLAGKVTVKKPPERAGCGER
jgi:hypothetical protein